MAKFWCMDLQEQSLGARIKAHLNAFWKENRQFFLLLFCIVFFKSAIADLSSISGASMQPTLLDGDKVWVNKLAYDVKIPFTEISLAEVGDPERGDIVIIDSKRASKRLVKRIVGLPGDTITYRGEQLYINGNAVPRDDKGLYTGADADISDDMRLFIEHLPDGPDHKMLHVVGRAGPEVSMTVPEDEYFAMGDNRDNSADSRVWGFVPEDNLVGRAFMIWLSVNVSEFDIRFSRIGTLLH